MEALASCLYRALAPKPQRPPPEYTQKRGSAPTHLLRPPTLPPCVRRSDSILSGALSTASAERVLQGAMDDIMGLEELSDAYDEMMMDEGYGSDASDDVLARRAEKEEMARAAALAMRAYVGEREGRWRDDGAWMMVHATRRRLAGTAGCAVVVVLPGARFPAECRRHDQAVTCTISIPCHHHADASFRVWHCLLGACSPTYSPIRSYMS